VFDRNQVHEGMVVRDSNGKKLGRVLSCKEGGFVVEKGLFLITDHAARYDDIAQVSGNTVQLSRSWEELAHGERARLTGDERFWPSYGDEGGGGLLFDSVAWPGPETRGQLAAGAGDGG
jgi:hypothetical protein